ncbi:uncharacterized protein [Gossypium hirsutum]|uniref:Gag-pro-like protein n=1 Tax=Gossypium hirsutum TaxID=3635 RepID=A0ABM3BLG5_GOSHI|nr:uncharacterized protein LOC121228931 [Gossypium hirsutum]
MAGEMIENAIRGGKIKGEMTKRSAPRRKDNEVNNTNTFNTRAITVGQPKIAAVEQQSSQKKESNARQNFERMQFTPIPVTYRELYQSLYDAHAIGPFHLKPLQPPYPKWYDANARCEYHAGISGHSIKNCTGFKKAVERLIKIGVVKFDSTPNTENLLPNHGGQGVNAISEASERRMKENVTEMRIPIKAIWEEMMKKGMIASKGERERTRNYCEFYGEEGHETQNCEKFRALVQGFIDNKELQIFKGSSYKKEIGALEDEQQRISQPRIIISLQGNNEVSMLEKEDIASTSKDVQVEGSHTLSGKWYDTVGVREEPTKAKGVSTEKEKGAEMPVKEPVKEEEAKEFLKFLNHSEYSVVEQLHKQPARISVLALLLSSEAHKEALMKVLNETYVTHDISANKLDRLVNISTDNFIYFNDDEIPPRGRGLPIDDSHTKTCQNVVRAFDGTERKVMGRIDIPLEIEPNIYEVDLLVMDIKPSYNCLLGRPWIHLVGAVPSSLHQKLKLVTDRRLVTINTEENIIAAVTSKAPYVETNEESIECSFRSLEFVNVTFISKRSELLVPKIARATRMALQMMAGKGALPRKGLEKYLQGGTQIPELKEKRDHFGLGFKPDYKQRRKEIEKRQEGRRARLNRREVEWEPMTFPPISQTFISIGLLIDRSH